MNDTSAWSGVTDRLRDRFRPVRPHRRQYRLDLPRRVTMAQEVEHVLAVTRQLDRPAEAITEHLDEEVAAR